MASQQILTILSCAPTPPIKMGDKHRSPLALDSDPLADPAFLPSYIEDINDPSQRSDSDPSPNTRRRPIDSGYSSHITHCPSTTHHSTTSRSIIISPAQAAAQRIDEQVLDLEARLFPLTPASRTAVIDSACTTPDGAVNPSTINLYAAYYARNPTHIPDREPHPDIRRYLALINEPDGPRLFNRQHQVFGNWAFGGFGGHKVENQMAVRGVQRDVDVHAVRLAAENAPYPVGPMDEVSHWVSVECEHCNSTSKLSRLRRGVRRVSAALRLSKVATG